MNDLLTMLGIAVGFLGLIILVSLIARARYRRAVVNDRIVRGRLGIPLPKTSKSVGAGGVADGTGFPGGGDCSDGGGC